MNYLKYDNIISKDFNVFISGDHTFLTPERELEIISIPGRNGTLSIDQKRFSNVTIEYPAFIADDFSRNYNAFKAALFSISGYNKLSDTYDPECFRLARFTSTIDPMMTQLNRHGTFSIYFDCDPRRFLKSGERVMAFTSSGGKVKNPTLYASTPLIRAYGTGTFTIGGVTVRINAANSYTDIDCDLQEAYRGTVNCNGNITLVNGEFPTIKAEINTISMSGISRLEIVPRWWSI